MSADNYSNRVIKSYEILERVGAGGFGAVYRAMQPSVGREVAIKVILPQHASQPDFIRRFEVEAQTIARLEHPHIVPLYDYWRDPDGAFLVMRWLSGSLRTALRSGPWSVEDAARLLDQTASALTVAHREGIIHRDIKPDNILLDEDQNAYLADFGIAKDLNVGGTTEEGTVIGAPAYITPEQITGGPVTARSDIYSLGLVVYEILVGERAHADATTPVELISRHLNTPVAPLNSRRANLPAALNEVIQTATAKDPDHRYANMLRFAAAFRAALPSVQRLTAQPLVEPLTDRELEIMRLMIDGLSNPEIAQKLILTPGTVKWYVNQIYAKLDVHNRRQAIDRARQLHLFEHSATAMVAINGADAGSRADTPNKAAEKAPQPKLTVFAPVPVINGGRAEATLLGVPELVNPYKGLRAFQEVDAGDFFGRAALTERLLARLTSTDDGARFLAIAGPSGSGKSSVVRAGLIPSLRRNALPNSARWFITEMLPGTHPFEELEAALLRVSVSAVASLRDQMLEDRRGLVRAAKRILPGDQDVELVLVIDQFEELFTLVDDEAVRAHFIDNLLSAATDPRSRVRIILTLRADFYDRPLNYPRLAELMRSHTEIALPMTTSELERAIAGPAERIGMRFEPGLVAAMITDVSAQPGALPLLQYALTELFERRSDLTLTLGTYHTSGGLAGALARRADELFDDLEADGQAAAQQIFLRLVTLGDGTEDTRRRVLQAELESGIGVAAAVDEVLALYGKYRLLTFDRDPLTHGPTVEIAHEALIREWARLRDWLSDSRDELRIQRRLSSAAQDWIAAGRDVSFLASGARLTQFEALRTSELALTSDERAYVAASAAEYSRSEAEREAQQARELALAQHAATNAEKVVVSQRRLVTRMRQLVTVLVMFLIVAALLSTFAFNSRASALDNAATATYSQGQALNSEMTATVAQGQALNVAATSVANLKLADQQRLAAAANALVPGNTMNAETAALLAIRSLKDGYSTQGDNALQRASDFLFTEKIWNQTANDIAYSPDGKSLLYATNSDVVRRDIASGVGIQTYSTHTGASSFQLCRFSPDGTQVIALGVFGQLYIWDANSGKVLHHFSTKVIRQFLDPVLDISADGTRVLFGGSLFLSAAETGISSEFDMWDISQEQPIKQWQNNLTGANDISAALSPDMKYVAIGTGNDIELWPYEAGQASEPVAKLNAIGSLNGAVSVAFSPNSQLLLGSTGTGDVQEWDVASRQMLRVLKGHKTQASQISFSPDGAYALTAGVDGTARIWDAATGLELRRLTGHLNSVDHAVYSPNGKQVATLGFNDGIRFWAADISQPNGHLAKVPEGSFNIALSPDGKRLAFSSSYFYLLNLSPAADNQMKNLDYGNYFSQFSNAGVIATAKFDPQNDSTALIRLVDGESGKVLKIIAYPIPPEAVNAQYLDLALSPDGKLVAPIGLYQHKVIIYSTETLKPVQTLDLGSQSGWPAKAVFSPESDALLIGEFSGAVKLWSVKTGTAMASYSYGGNSGYTFSVRFSPDGKKVLAGWNGIGKLYNRDSGQLLQSFLINSSGGAIYASSFSPDGKLIVFPSYSAPMKIFDATTGNEVRVFGEDSSATFAAFSPDGKYIYTIRLDGTVRRWFADYHDLIADTCARLFRDLSPAERMPYGIADDTPTCPTSSATPTPIPATIAATVTPIATP